LERDLQAGFRIDHVHAASRSAHAAPRSLTRIRLFLRYQRDSAHNETPERIFERRWALSVIDRVMDRLRDEFLQHGRLDHFNRLKVFLLDQGETPYAALARELGRSEGALKVAIHRLRKRYRDLFRQEIAETVADPAEVESELRFLAGLKRII